MCTTAARDYGLRSLRAAAAVDNARCRAVLTHVGFIPMGRKSSWLGTGTCCRFRPAGGLILLLAPPWPGGEA
ncbi:MAG: hypothetical protein WBA97_13480, partial [Actinophytocola sp.]|uniref:hypothetical protein n=1 Tax=Actinophytocola sp. TaxID=1872138 RepID=UPI003C76E384